MFDSFPKKTAAIDWNLAHYAYHLPQRLAGQTLARPRV
jgi:hypothetical protein